MTVTKADVIAAAEDYARVEAIEKFIELLALLFRPDDTDAERYEWIGKTYRWWIDRNCDANRLSDELIEAYTKQDVIVLINVEHDWARLMWRPGMNLDELIEWWSKQGDAWTLTDAFRNSAADMVGAFVESGETQDDWDWSNEHMPGRFVYCVHQRHWRDLNAPMLFLHENTDSVLHVMGRGYTYHAGYDGDERCEKCGAVLESQGPWVHCDKCES